MCFLLRRDDEDYKLCYSEPKRPYVVDNRGTYWCAYDYSDMCNAEREVEAHAAMDADNFPTDGWADVSNNDLGISVSVDIAEYMLQGKILNVDEFVELEIVAG